MPVSHLGQAKRSSRLAERGSNLPADITLFVGRRRELSEVRKLLASSRLVTLTGVGGMGKSRLALRAASSSRRAFRHGTWLVELAAVRDPRLVAQTVATSLGLQDRASQPIDHLSAYLQDKQLLLVLDNCEHLLDACAPLADQLLHAAPELTILTTGREALGLTGEVIYPVPPLAVPDQHRPPPPLEALAQYESVALFVELACRVHPGFEVTEENRNAVVSLCQRLDGMPLAIELAAARLRYLSVEQIVRRVDQRYKLLSSGSRTALAHHQTLRALIDWSYDLCTPRERDVWARLSVFAGSFDLDAAKHVCAGGGIDGDDVEELVGGLVAKSVLLVDSGGALPHYRLLETVRAYGLEQLGTEDVPVRRRHRDYYAALAAEAEQRMFTADQAEWQSRLRVEHANLRAALDFCVTGQGEADAGLALAAALWQYWVASGSVTEGQHWLNRLLAASSAPAALRAKGLWLAAWLAILQNDSASATARLEESAELGEALGDRSVLGYVALFSGILATLQRDLQRAAALYEQALSYHRAAEEPIGVAMALYRKALIALLRGDSQEVHTLCDACRALCDTYRENWWKAYALWVDGLQYWRNGDVPRATAAEREALELFQHFDDKLGTAMTLEAFAWMAAEDEPAHAATLLGAASTLWQILGPALTEFAYLRSYHQDCERTASRSCGRDAFRKAFEYGSDLAVDIAVDVALGRTGQQHARGGVEPAETTWSTVLTPREREIAVLLAEGLSNKEIARRLVVALRTAEAHVEHILTKLGFTSRNQVAAWVAEHRPAAQDDK